MTFKQFNYLAFKILKFFYFEFSKFQVWSPSLVDQHQFLLGRIQPLIMENHNKITERLNTPKMWFLSNFWPLPLPCFILIPCTAFSIHKWVQSVFCLVLTLQPPNQTKPNPRGRGESQLICDPKIQYTANFTEFINSN